MFNGILAAADEVAATPGVRAVVLHGEGPSFCSGLDVALAHVASSRSRSTTSSSAARTARTSRSASPPTGSTCRCRSSPRCTATSSAAACRSRSAPTSASPRPARGSASWSHVGPRARHGHHLDAAAPRAGSTSPRSSPTPRAGLAATEAAALGLVTRIADDPLAAARELAAEIAGRSPDAVRAAKKLYDTSWQGPVDEALVLESELQRALLGSKNQMAAVTAGFTKEPAEFEDPEPVRARDAACRGPRSRRAGDADGADREVEAGRQRRPVPGAERRAVGQPGLPADRGRDSRARRRPSAWRRCRSARGCRARRRSGRPRSAARGPSRRAPEYATNGAGGDGGRSAAVDLELVDPRRARGEPCSESVTSSRTQRAWRALIVAS